MTPKKLDWLTALLVFSLSIPALAAGVTREAVVADLNTSLAVSGVAVRVADKQVATTDSEGRFRVDVDDADTLEITKDGYQSLSTSGSQPVLWLQPLGNDHPNLFINTNLQGTPTPMKTGFRLSEYYPSSYQGNGEHAIDTEVHRLSNRSLRLRSTDPARISFQQRIDVEAGVTYRFRVWYRQDENLPPEGVQVRLIPYTTFPTVLSIQDVKAWSPQVASGTVFVNWNIMHLGGVEWAIDTWQPLDIAFTVPAEVTQIAFEFMLWQAAGTIWFAEPTLVKLAQ